MSSVGQMRLDQADLARDAKKEQAMCAKGLCTSSGGLRPAPSGFSGQYGGHKVCQDCYESLCDHIAKHGCLPSEKE